MTGRRHTNTPSARKFIIAQKHPALQAVSGKFCIFYKQFTSLPEDRSSPGACLRFDVRLVSPSAHPRTSTSSGSLLFKEKQRTTFPFLRGMQAFLRKAGWLVLSPLVPR